MKKLACILIALTLSLGVTACGRSGNGSSSEVSQVSEPPAVSSEAEVPPAPESAGPFTSPADASMYRGTVTEVVTGDTGTVVKLAQAPGTDFGTENLEITIDDTTKHDLELADLHAGDYLEVYYGTDTDTATNFTAIQVAKLPEAAMSLYNGTVKMLTPGEAAGNGDMLLTSLDSENTIVFHYNNQTQFYMNFADLKVGDKVNVYFNGITTRSEPPQATAMEVRPFAE